MVLFKGVDTELHPLLRRSSGLHSLCKEIVDLLREPATTGGERGLPCSAEELVALGEQAIELEELEDVVRWQWPRREEQQTAHKKLLQCDIVSPHALLRALSEPVVGRCRLNCIFEEAGFKCLRAETINELAAELQVRVQQRIHIGVQGTRPLLVTAPHNIYLHRDGHTPHMMEEYTTLIAQRIARRLGGTCIAWSRAEQRRSELLWFSGKRQDLDPMTCIDPRNRDPNYLKYDEVCGNPWFKHVSKRADSFRDNLGCDSPMLHIDVHGCRDPPCTPSHLTVGLAAMLREIETGRSSVSMVNVKIFAEALEEELASALSGLGLAGRGEPLVRVLMPILRDGHNVERLSGAWPLSERRVTQSQQAVAFAGFTHSCQLELSKALRLALSRDEVATSRFGSAINKAWLVSTGTSIPSLPHVKLHQPGPGRASGCSKKRAANSAPPGPSRGARWGRRDR